MLPTNQQGRGVQLIELPDPSPPGPNTWLALLGSGLAAGLGIALAVAIWHIAIGLSVAAAAVGIGSGLGLFLKGAAVYRLSASQGQAEIIRAQGDVEAQLLQVHASLACRQLSSNGDRAPALPQPNMKGRNQ